MFVQAFDGKAEAGDEVFLVADHHVDPAPIRARKISPTTAGSARSMSGLIVTKPQPQAHDNASKAGVHHLTTSFAAKWPRRGVRVNAFAPTSINTPLLSCVKTEKPMFEAWMGGTPMARMGEPEEVAAVVLLRASDASSLMTG